eukprot:660468-Amphidinium_carterae.1
MHDLFPGRQRQALSGNHFLRATRGNDVDLGWSCQNWEQMRAPDRELLSNFTFAADIRQSVEEICNAPVRERPFKNTRATYHKVHQSTCYGTRR